MNSDYQIEQLELEDVLPSPTNPRTIFNETDLADLASSIARKGVIQPILVRRRTCDFRVEASGGRWAVINPFNTTMETCDTEGDARDAMRLIWERQPQYELVAGERRWRASKLAKAEMIPSIVLDLDDRAALEFQVIENLQRVDLSPMEEARGYRQMIDEYGYVADELASKVGKSKAYIYARLKLVNLPEAAERALAKGEISVSIAEIMARVPSMEMREDLCREIFADADKGWYRQPTFRGVRELIESRYMRELKGAPFDQGDKKLCAAAGSCKACPKRTGNDRVSYPDARADICTDPGCYAGKVEAHRRREMARLASAGAEILTPEQSKALVGYGGLNPKGALEYVSLDEECWELPDDEDGEEKPPRTYGEILGDGVQIVAVAQDPHGNPHRLVARAAVEGQLKEAGIELPPDVANAAEDDARQEKWRREQAEAAQKQKIRAAAAREAGEAVAAFFEEHYDEALSADPLRALTAAICEDASGRIPQELTAIAKRRGVQIETKAGSHARVKDLANQTTAGQVLGVLAEVALALRVLGWVKGYQPVLVESEICEAANIDLLAIEKRLTRERKDAEKGQSKKATKATKAKEVHA